MAIENVIVTQETANITVTQAPPTNVTVTPPDVINIELATEGLQGAVGPTPDLQIGTVDTGAAGSMADATITGTITEPLLNLIIPRGDKGETGDTGPTGPANTLTISGVTQLAPSDSPTVSVSGISPNQALAFGIPAGAKILNGTAAPASGTGLQGDWFLNTTTSDLYEKTSPTVWTLRTNIKGLTGDTGATGATGPANQLSVDSVTASAPGSAPSVTIGGAAPSQTISFVLPRGDTGPTGPAPNLTIGTVTTGTPGSSADVVITGTNPNYVLNLDIPRGDKGEIGAQWITGADAPTGGIGVIGDFYLVTGVTGTGDVYKKTDATTWTLQGNIRGQAGSGNVNSVNSVLPDVNGDVLLTWGNFTGTIPESALPAQAISDTFTVASEAAMLALTAQRGDYAIRTDEGSTYILTAEPASTLANWTLFRVNASNITTGTLPMGVIPTGTTGSTVALGDHGHALTDANITGIIPNAQLPARLGNPDIEVVTDWDSAVEPGFYYSSGTALNAPSAVALIGTVTRGVSANNVTQRLTAQSDSNNSEWIRKRSGGVWGVWETTMSKVSVLDARYAQVANTVLITGAQTIAGVKTFSSSPIVPTPAGTTDAANKAYVDSGLSGKANTAHTHDAADTTTGTFAIARIPTGTTGTTVALGNHLHTGVYEPVIAAGTISQYRRGDNTWRDLGSDAVLLTGAQTIAGTKTFSSTLIAQALTVGATSSAAQVEIGRTDGVASSPYIDFHSGATLTDFDSRIQASGGTGTNGAGTITFTAATATFSGAVTGASFSGSGANITGVVHTTGDETIAGTKTFSGQINTTSNRGMQVTHSTNVADGILLTNTVTANGFSPRIFWQNDIGGNVIMRSTTNLIITTGAVPGSSSGTAGITLSDAGNVTLANDLTIGGVISTQKPIIDWNGTSTTSQWQKRVYDIATWNGNVAAPLGEVVFDTEMPNIRSTMTMLHFKGQMHSVSDAILDLIVRFYWSAGAINTTQVINNGTFPISSVKLYLKTDTNTLSVALATSNPDWDWGKIWVDGYFGHGSVLADSEFDGWTSSVIADPLVSGYTLITSLTPVEAVHTDNAQTISGAKTFSAPLGIGGATSPASTIANTSTNTLSGGTGINAAGITMLASGAGFVGSFTNTGTATSANGIFASTTSVSASTVILAADSGGVNRFKILGDGSAVFSTAVTTGGVLTVPGTSYQTFGASGVAAPTFTTRSAGTKIVLYEGITASAVDYAIGIEGSTLWQSVPTNSAGLLFKWYGGTTNVMTLTGTGNLSTAGTITAGGTGFIGSGSGITSLSASNLSSGVIPDSQLPVRLRAGHNNDVPNNDWNSALETGWYASSTAANSPSGGTWHLGYVEAHHTGWVTQTVHQFANSDGSGDTKMYRRSRDSGPADGNPVGGTWSAWYRVRISEAEQDDRYARNTGGGREKFVYINPASGTLNLDVSLYSIFELSQTGNITINLTNVPTGASGTNSASTVTVLVYGNGTGYTITPPTGTRMLGAAMPTSTAGKFIALTFQNLGHTSWTLCSAVKEV